MDLGIKMNAGNPLRGAKMMARTSEFFFNPTFGVAEFTLRFLRR
jgi:hypothetical protein